MAISLLLARGEHHDEMRLDANFQALLRVILIPFIYDRTQIQYSAHRNHPRSPLFDRDYNTNNASMRGKNPPNCAFSSPISPKI